MSEEMRPVQTARPALTVAAGIATAVVLVAVSIVPFLTPAWIGFEQGRAQAAAWTGLSDAELRTATDAIVADLVLGPGSFDVEVRGAPVLNERERSHMRDVRGVFIGLWTLALAAVLVLVGSFHVTRSNRRSWYRAVARGAAWLAIGVVVVGAIAAVAFEPLFEVFHRLFFAGGTYTFDPRTERLVQLFPFTFWQETTIAVGALIVALAVATWWLASRRAQAVTAEPRSSVAARPAVSR